MFAYQNKYLHIFKLKQYFRKLKIQVGRFDESSYKAYKELKVVLVIFTIGRKFGLFWPTPEW